MLTSECIRTWLYRLLKWLVIRPGLHLYLQGRIYGTERVPKRGPVIVVANHASHVDSPILSCCLRRPVSFMADSSLFDIPILGTAIRAYGAYPVKRGAVDRSAIRSAIGQLKEDWAIGIYLNGGRSQDARIVSPKLGAALIAAQTQVPLLPVSLWGTEKVLPKGLLFPKPYRVTVRIGEVIPPPANSSKAELRATIQRCTDAIHALHDLGR